jgi:hypothetical protein
MAVGVPYKSNRNKRKKIEREKNGTPKVLEGQDCKNY